MEVGEQPSALADGGAYGFDDDGFRGHELVLSGGRTGVPAPIRAELWETLELVRVLVPQEVL
ncbi:hypothetical protein GCM10010381_13570 [Streptomyces xantholiticus]|nr:hypothetical protein GCM10010381_13570 [Streptomyces xantholiticus]